MNKFVFIIVAVLAIIVFVFATSYYISNSMAGFALLLSTVLVLTIVILLFLFRGLLSSYLTRVLSVEGRTLEVELSDFLKEVSSRNWSQSIEKGTILSKVAVRKYVNFQANRFALTVLIGLIAGFGGLAGVVILHEQNQIISDQNTIIRQQNQSLLQQFSLAEQTAIFDQRLRFLELYNAEKSSEENKWFSLMGLGRLAFNSESNRDATQGIKVNRVYNRNLDRVRFESITIDSTFRLAIREGSMTNSFLYHCESIEFDNFEIRNTVFSFIDESDVLASESTFNECAFLRRDKLFSHPRDAKLERGLNILPGTKFDNCLFVNTLLYITDSTYFTNCIFVNSGVLSLPAVNSKFDLTDLDPVSVFFNSLTDSGLDASYVVADDWKYKRGLLPRLVGVKRDANPAHLLFRKLVVDEFNGSYSANCQDIRDSMLIASLSMSDQRDSVGHYIFDTLFHCPIPLTEIVQVEEDL